MRKLAYQLWARLQTKQSDTYAKGHKQSKRIESVESIPCRIRSAEPVIIKLSSTRAAQRHLPTIGAGDRTSRTKSTHPCNQRQRLDLTGLACLGRAGFDRHHSA
jgi:hypothetical protein